MPDYLLKYISGVFWRKTQNNNAKVRKTEVENMSLGFSERRTQLDALQ